MPISQQERKALVQALIKGRLKATPKEANEVVYSFCDGKLSLGMDLGSAIGHCEQNLGKLRMANQIFGD